MTSKRRSNKINFVMPSFVSKYILTAFLTLFKDFQNRTHAIRVARLNTVHSKSLVLPLGKTFQAIVSVTAVNIQFSSPSGVRRSFSLPGILIKSNDFSK